MKAEQKENEIDDQDAKTFRAISNITMSHDQDEDQSSKDIFIDPPQQMYEFQCFKHNIV